MIKILFSDLDGTLLESPRPGKQIVITDSNREALQRLEANGVTFCIASGRNYLYVENVKKEIGTPDCDMISCNGAVVIMENNMFKHMMEIDDVRLLADYYYENDFRNGVRIAAVDENNIYYADYLDDDYFEKNYGRTYICNYDMTIADYLKDPEKYAPYQKMYVNVVDGNPEKWVSLFRGRFEPDLDYGSPYVGRMEFMHKGVNKGDAIEWFMDYYGLDLEEVAAIGDADNDIAMLQKVKYSFVVETGMQSAKDVAYKVVKDFADGVDFILEFNRNNP